MNKRLCEDDQREDEAISRGTYVIIEIGEI